MKLKFKNRGMIFRLKDYPEFESLEFAQSPQAIEFDEYIRVYFTSRRRDGDQYISLPFFADFTKDFSSVIKVSEGAVMDLGGLGTFDEHGVFPFSPMVDRDNLVAFSTGWSRRVSVPVETSVGLAVSDDKGGTFTRHGEGPIKGASDSEPFLVGDAFVRKFGNRYHMFYIFGTSWLPEIDGEPVARVYKIGMCSSESYYEWPKGNGRAIIADTLGEHECQALPTVCYYDRSYVMAFAYRNHQDFRKNKSNAYRIGIAFSDDLRVWNRQEQELDLETSNKTLWDDSMKCYPSLFESEGKLFMLYNGNEFGKHGFGLAECISSD